MKTVLCFGDSNTWGFDPETQQRFPYDVRWTGRLQSLLGPEWRVLEEGLNGRTTCVDDPVFPGRNGIRQIDTCMQTHMPVDVVVLMLGVNDTKLHLCMSAYASAKGVEQLIRRIQNPEYGTGGKPPAVLLISPMRIGDHVESCWTGREFDRSSIAKAKRFGEFYEAVARETGCAFLDAAGITEPDVHDAIHMNAENHEALAHAVSQKLKPMCRAWTTA